MKTIITLDSKKFGRRYYDAAHVQVIDDKGLCTAKYVDVDQLLAALEGAKAFKEQLHRIGKIPQNYYEGAFQRDSGGMITGQIALIVPAVSTPTQFENTRYDHIPYPALLFYYSILKGKIRRTEVYALKGVRHSKQSVLYNYPFGNVNTSGHAVCWGENVLPEITELRQLDAVCSLFYGSPCNNDHYVPARSTKWNCQNLRQVFERLNTVEAFPEKILVSSGKGLVKSLLSSFL